MNITKEMIEEWQNIDIREVCADDLVQIKDIKIDAKLSKEERISQYIEQIKNPYLYADGKSVIKITYSDNDITLEDCIANYLNGL